MLLSADGLGTMAIQRQVGLCVAASLGFFPPIMPNLRTKLLTVPLGAVERLDFALLIDRQHQCVLRRIDIEADDNAAHVKYLPGRKTDVNDATWLADLLAHGLIRGSFVPDRLRRPTLLAPL